MGRIVVGVDGSDESQTALRWAANEARLRDATLEVTYVYSAEPEPGTEHMPLMAGAPDEDRPDLREAARSAAEELIERMLGLLDDVGGLTTRAVALDDEHPAHALAEQARNADMLVVGSRGRGGFAGLMLGSVSQQCTRHATCPVTVVPTGDDTAS